MTRARKIFTQRGFTLIEILVVIVIIGVLSIMGVGKYTEFTTQSRLRACVGNANSIDSNVGVWESQNVAIPRASSAATVSSIQFNTNGMITNVTGAAGAITGAKNTLSTIAATTTNANNESIFRLVKDQNTFCCPERANIQNGAATLHLAASVENDFVWRYNSTNTLSLGNKVRGTECVSFGTANGPDGTTDTSHR